MSETRIEPTPLTPSDQFPAAVNPTMYFIGVTTHKSSIMNVFPRWANHWGLEDARIRGINFKQHDAPDNYRRAVDFIKHDPLSLGALVTTHKLDLLSACRNQFDQLDEFALLMHEVSSLSKRDGQLIGHAKDPITSGLAIEALLPANYWKNSGAEALILGAGGSAIALSWYLLSPDRGANRPTRIVVTNRSKKRLEEIQALHQSIEADLPLEYHLTPTPESTDSIMRDMNPGALVVNATGLGKDAPGSPLTNSAIWPQDGIAWDFNYRGNLKFLDQARAQQQERNLSIADGWVYFLQGWTRVIAEVFGIDIPTSGPAFDKLSEIASNCRITN
ncbi:MAG: hypothetical protein P8N76_26435 [Pirellulaceae bacterium]|nr:hypothetical protein [Pirellulaceae bacterium]